VEPDRSAIDRIVPRATAPGIVSGDHESEGNAMDEVITGQLEQADERWLRHWLRGPTRTRWESSPVQVGDPAPDLDLVDSLGNPTRLSAFWADRPAHLFLMRHFGCSCMKDRWGQLNQELPQLAAAGLGAVAIGMGEPERTRLFMEARSITVPVLCDPEGRAYDAYGVIEGPIPTVLHDFEWSPGDEETGRELADSRRGGDLRLVDNPWILPAEFIVDQRGLIRHAHRYQYCEDYPPATVLVGAARSAASA